MTAYKELQARAKVLGIPSVGVSAEDLENLIQAKEAESSTEEPVKTPGEFNTAIVLDNGREVRQYTLEEHGDDFAELAETFAKKHKYSVELRDVKPGQRCPHCGGLI